MAKNQNTFEKRRREMDKRQKAAEKRARRQTRKDSPPVYESAHPPHPLDEDPPQAPAE